MAAVTVPGVYNTLRTRHDATDGDVTLDADELRPIDACWRAVGLVQNLGDKGDYLTQAMGDKRSEPKHSMDKHGQDLPEIRHWKWGDPE